MRRQVIWADFAVVEELHDREMTERQLRCTARYLQDIVGESREGVGTLLTDDEGGTEASIDPRVGRA